ncbi:transcriptional regulator [Streptomyces sp. NPDC085900]|uniref:transcriptional regulator n=1 Tax=Streptomyces sp. NPDC085900 TaxID=3365737 RepID=UPI0037D93DA1
MTAVHTTEPPRLPVRQKVAAAERGWGGVSPMLTRLAAERATGILFREHGTLHLADGLVVHAESPCAPGLETLLTAHGTLAAEVWRQALGETDDDHQAGHLAGLRLVDAGLLTLGAFELCRLTALYDAAYFVLAPSSTPGRFRYGTAPAPGHRAAVRRVPVAALERETLRRRDLLHRIWPDPVTDEAPLARTDLPAAPALTRRQRAVLVHADGVRTAPDIARALGHLAFHTLVDVRRLAAAGVLAPLRPAVPEPPEPPPGPAGEGRAAPEPAQPPDPGQPPPLPTRGRPPYDAAGPGPAQPAPGHGMSALTEPLPPDPHITLLKRLRDALEAL